MCHEYHPVFPRCRLTNVMEKLICTDVEVRAFYGTWMYFTVSFDLDILLYVMEWDGGGGDGLDWSGSG
jgi:hypothetical protein